MSALVSIRGGLAAGLLLLSGCAGIPLPEYTPIESPTQQAFLVARLRESQSLTNLVERARITRDGEEVVLTIYAASDSPEHLKLAGVSDLGATLFSVEMKGAEVEVLQESAGFQESFLERFVPDQLVALLPPDGGTAQLVRLPGGQTALYYEKCASQVLAHVGRDQETLRLERGEGGDSLATIELGGSGVTEAFEVRASDGSYTGRFELLPWR